MSKPLRQSVAAMALISIGAPRRWLSRWNANWRGYNLVGGHREEGETFRECVIREVEEELRLDHAAGAFDVASGCRARLDYTAFSESAGVETHYLIELFEVTLSAAALPLVERDPQNCWLTEEEIRAGQCAGGKRVSPTTRRLLEQSGLLARC